MKVSGTLLFAAVLAFGTTVASAATVTISSVTGKWVNSDPGPSDIDGTGTSSIRWGVAATVLGRSGYDFVGTAPPPFDIDDGEKFSLGTFAHLNNPIYSPSLKSVDLEVTINTTIGDIVTTFSFTHDETPNGSDPCKYGGDNGQGVNINGCADRVSAVLNTSSTSTFTIGDTTYHFTVGGFEVGGTVFEDFLTMEKSPNTAVLKAMFVTSPSVVPLPETSLLLLGGLAGLGAVARRKKKTA